MRIRRWWYALLTYRDYYRRLNRSVEVEIVLLNVAKGKRPMLSREECLQLALKLGVSNSPEHLK